MGLLWGQSQMRGIEDTGKNWSTWRKPPHWHNVCFTHHWELICLTCPYKWHSLHESLNLSITHNLLDVADITYSDVFMWTNTWCLRDPAPRAFTSGFIIFLSSSHKYSYSTLKPATTESLPNSLFVFILPHNRGLG